MSLNDYFEDPEPAVVNVYEFYRSFGVSDQAAVQMVLHLLLTQSFATEADARAIAVEFKIEIPFVFNDNGKLH